MNILPLFASLILVCGVSVSSAREFTEKASDSTKPTVDGRFDTRCASSRTDASRELCYVSFYRLVASPERYHGKWVAVSGYLTQVSGRAVLFPNESSRKANALSEGIVLLDAKIPRQIESRLDGLVAVSVSGIFDARYEGWIAYPVLGALKDVVNVTLAMPPSSAPSEYP